MDRREYRLGARDWPRDAVFVHHPSPEYVGALGRNGYDVQTVDAPAMVYRVQPRR